MVDTDELPPAKPPKKQDRKHLLIAWSSRKLLLLKEKLEERVRVRALAALHDAVPHMGELAREGGARDAPAAMRELRALALPDREKAQAAPTSPGADVARILEALPRLISSLPGGRAAAPALLGSIEADYELLDTQSVASVEAKAGQGDRSGRAAPPTVAGVRVGGDRPTEAAGEAPTEKGVGGDSRAGASPEVSPSQPQVVHLEPSLGCARHALSDCAVCANDRTAPKALL